MERVIKIGVMPLDKQIERTIAIAKGEYKPKNDEPKIWFTSMSSVAQVLSDANQALLKLIAESHPESVSSLAREAGRATSNVSRTLKTLETYGIVKLRRESRNVIPETTGTSFDIKTGDFGYLRYRSKQQQICA